MKLELPWISLVVAADRGHRRSRNDVTGLGCRDSRPRTGSTLRIDGRRRSYADFHDSGRVGGRLRPTMPRLASVAPSRGDLDGVPHVELARVSTSTVIGEAFDGPSRIRSRLAAGSGASCGTSPGGAGRSGGWSRGRRSWRWAAPSWSWPSPAPRTRRSRSSSASWSTSVNPETHRGLAQAALTRTAACLPRRSSALAYLVREALNVLRRFLVENTCTRIDKDMCVRLVAHLMKVDLVGPGARAGRGPARPDHPERRGVGPVPPDQLPRLHPGAPDRAASP